MGRVVDSIDDRAANEIAGGLVARPGLGSQAVATTATSGA
jgi:hypothetical protein